MDHMDHSSRHWAQEDETWVAIARNATTAVFGCRFVVWCALFAILQRDVLIFGPSTNLFVAQTLGRLLQALNREPS
jgi:methylase of polypeptide subunit release factors